MKLLFICSTSGELKTVKSQIKNLNLKEKVQFDYLNTGIGNYNVIFSLTNYLNENKRHPEGSEGYDFIINIGVCGFQKDLKIHRLKDSKIEREKCIQVGRIFNLTTKKESLVPIFFEFGPIKSIACSENIVYEKNNLGEENFVDMESFAVEFVADKFRIPRIILKVPVDEVGEETKNFDYEKALKLLENNIDYKGLFEKVKEYIVGTIPNSRDSLSFAD